MNKINHFIKVIKRNLIILETKPFSMVLLPPTCKINYVNMQHNYVNMQLMYVNMQDNYAHMQHKMLTCNLFKSTCNINLIKIRSFDPLP